MRLARFGNSAPLNRGLFVLGTLLACTTMASLFVVLKRAPLTHGDPLTTYPTLLGGLLPWLSGFVFWTKVRKRARLSIADRDATNFCNSIIVNSLISAYVAIVSIESLLLWVLTRVR